MNRITLVLSLALLFGCTAEGLHGEAPPEDLTKAEAADLNKADHTMDFCAYYGWYGDGVCDDFCPLMDEDCGSTEPSPPMASEYCTATCESFSGTFCFDSADCHEVCAANESDTVARAATESCMGGFDRCPGYLGPCVERRSSCISACQSADLSGDSCQVFRSCTQICAENDPADVDLLVACLEEDTLCDRTVSECMATRRTGIAPDSRCAETCGSAEVECLVIDECIAACPDESDAAGWNAMEDCLTDGTVFCHQTLQGCIDSRL